MRSSELMLISLEPLVVLQSAAVHLEDMQRSSLLAERSRSSDKKSRQASGHARVHDSEWTQVLLRVHGAAWCGPRMFLECNAHERLQAPQ